MVFVKKLISRHPHIYGDVKVDNEEDVKQNWEKLKLKEGKKSVLGGVPRSLPSMVKAMRLQEKSKQVGFEWENSGQVWHKVEEEIAELKEAVSQGNQPGIEEEMGDVFFPRQLCTLFAGGCRKCTGKDQQEIHGPFYPHGINGGQRK